MQEAQETITAEDQGILEFIRSPMEQSVYRAREILKTVPVDKVVRKKIDSICYWWINHKKVTEVNRFLLAKFLWAFSEKGDEHGVDTDPA